MISCVTVSAAVAMGFPPPVFHRCESVATTQRLLQEHRPDGESCNCPPKSRLSSRGTIVSPAASLPIALYSYLILVTHSIKLPAFTTVAASWKTVPHGMLSAAASLGSILLWNVEEGLTQIDKYLYSSEDYVKAGATLAVGILSCGVRNDADPALALLMEHVEGDSHIIT